MGSAAPGYDAHVAISDVTSANQPDGRDGRKDREPRQPGNGRGPGRPRNAALVIGALGGRALSLESLPDTGNLRDDLLAIRRIQLELLSSSEGQRVLPGLAADMSDHPELHPRFCERYVAPWREAMQKAVERAVARGEIPSGPDGRLVADVLTGPLVFRMLYAGEQVDELALEPAVDLILAGLGHNGRSE